MSIYIATDFRYFVYHFILSLLKEKNYKVPSMLCAPERIIVGVLFSVQK